MNQPSLCREPPGMTVFGSACQVMLTSVRLDMPASMTFVSGTFGWLPLNTDAATAYIIQQEESWGYAEGYSRLHLPDPMMHSLFAVLDWQAKFIKQFRAELRLSLTRLPLRPSSLVKLTSGQLLPDGLLASGHFPHVTISRRARHKLYLQRTLSTRILKSNIHMLSFLVQQQLSQI